MERCEHVRGVMDGTCPLSLNTRPQAVVCDGAEYVVERREAADEGDAPVLRRVVAFAVNGQPQGVAFEDVIGGAPLGMSSFCASAPADRPFSTHRCVFSRGQPVHQRVAGDAGGDDVQFRPNIHVPSPLL